MLAGIGMAAAMQSVIQYVFTRVDEYDVQLVLRWLTGSVNGVAWSTIGLLGARAGGAAAGDARGPPGRSRSPSSATTPRPASVSVAAAPTC